MRGRLYTMYRPCYPVNMSLNLSADVCRSKNVPCLLVSFSGSLRVSFFLPLRAGGIFVPGRAAACATRSAYVCKHLARKISDGSWTGVNWGIAGRSRTKLEDKVVIYAVQPFRTSAPGSRQRCTGHMVLLLL